MKRIVLGFAVGWGALITWFVMDIFSMETSISPGTLASVAYSPISVLLLLLIILGFLIWLIPVLLCWLFFRRRKKSSARD